ncbi:ribose-phosphate pyrophosphokinase [Thiohalorhabdus methylotrophus]|uniref:Ribose-phosphate pyrophosphokinase n=1 Tax=Thiohalorhabdus methylotrophus TaxID=3242694 RepID=A0ABV4TTE5_9GAMM
MANSDLALFTGNANRDLAEKVAHHIGVPLGQAEVGSFSDGEVHVEFLENVRGRDVFVIQPTCAPANTQLMELLAMLDALKRASAARITAVVPYYGYARQDRRANGRTPITAKLVADLITTAGADRVLTMDLHADQIQGFFDMPVDNIYASPVLLGELNRMALENLVVISPDVGGVVRARALAKRLDAELAIIDKRRPRANEAQVMNIIGSVEGRHCVIVDDMVDTANTLCRAATALKEKGAKSVMAAVTHPVLSGEAMDNIDSSGLDTMLVTDTIPLSERAAASSKIRVLTISELLAEAIRRVNREDSVSSLFPE